MLNRLNLTFGKLQFGNLDIWEVVTWEVAFGKMHLGKYLSPVLSISVSLQIKVICNVLYIGFGKFGGIFLIFLLRV